MDVPLNNSPDLSMAEITQKLFNSKFLSDIQFRVAGHVMYAHSLELMKRSVVFQRQLEHTWGDSKLIPIQNFSYASFYQFIRFIYTDMCELNGEILFDVFKLALKYKIPKLENKAMEYLNSSKYTLRLFQKCVSEGFTLPFGRAIETLVHDMPKYLCEDEFLAIQPNALEQILRFERINISEAQLFQALMRWMDSEMERNPMSLEEGRIKFDRYIQLIRFSSMSVDDVLGGLSKKYKWFTEHDFNLIFKQIEDRCPDDQHIKNCKCRSVYSYPYDWITLPKDLIVPTTFTVPKDLLLIGIRYGNNTPETNHLIKLSSLDLGTNTTRSVEFKNPKDLNERGSRIFSFGNSLLLQPNNKYTLSIFYLESIPKSSFLLRKANRNLIIRAPNNSVRLIDAGLNIIELHFRPVAVQALISL